ncbi:MAG: hypothetical protein F6K15_33460 [Okeania sp. SIO2B3]|nr:hypothetical protein [Okeania sp. SIO2B3]
MARSKRPESSRAGFVLPTVTMVLLVVVLLSIAITLRSFNRLETARVSKVNQATLAAAAPALDRASAKLDRLFETKFQATPKDTFLYSLLESSLYDFGDEMRLRIAFDVDGSGGIDPPNDTLALDDDEETQTAWMFPVDTDNDSKYDSYGLYSILFRNPSRYEEQGDNLGEFNRSRNPLEARTPPMLPAGSEANEVCQAAKGTSSSIVGDSDWFKSDGELKKSFFIYAATVPITANQAAALGDNYEAGASGFSALEYQQDRERTPANNNAVWFEDDLELSNVSNFRVNGRIVTNGNLMPRSGSFGPIVFYQVSDHRSCFYEADKSKILVGGHVSLGDLRFNNEDDSRAAEVHRFREGDLPTGIGELGEGINGTNKTTTEIGGAEVANNIRAYNARIGNMVDTAMLLHDTSAGWTAGSGDPRPVPDEDCSDCTGLPEGVITDYRDRANGVGSREVLIDTLETYYKNRTRKVPFADTSSNDLPGGFTSNYEPPDNWNDITTNNLDIHLGGNNLAFLPTSDPDDTDEDDENFIGDRISVGYGLPSLDLQGDKKKADFNPAQQWNDPNDITQPSGNIRTQETQIDSLPDLGATFRNGYWEQEAAKIPKAYENSGGVRIVTGAGIYLPEDTTLAATDWGEVWSDTMPMAQGHPEVLDKLPDNRPYLQMRGTVVYHYTQGQDEDDQANLEQTPYACVSSYYDPTDATSASNEETLPLGAADGLSNNGIVYSPPTARNFTDADLVVQSELTYPDGRYVNKPLRDAINRPASDRTFADYSAVDAAQCALDIIANPTSANEIIPHGSVKEVAFLDAREVKSLNRLNTNEDEKIEWLEIAEIANLTDQDWTRDLYDLPLEQRQPLEIRATELDLSLFRSTQIGGEFLLPNSGVIYATRDDALTDVTSVEDEDLGGDINDPTFREQLDSSSDFLLDPSRRPNAIRLINGTDISRATGTVNSGEQQTEKGLILATNLPVYIQAAAENGLFGFNLHKDPNSGTRRDEFNNILDSDWGDFYARGNENAPNDGLNRSFACRNGQDGCDGNGDQWRTATVLGDSITLLSSDWQDGFRNQGDYDLRNNAGNSAVVNRLQNGFWFNDFVTSADWVDDTNQYPTADFMTSYLANAVTPIQRRVDNFPEYVMEMCPKLPVSECGAQDWVVGYNFNADPDWNDNEVTLTAAFGSDVDLNGDGDATDTDVTEADVTLKRAFELAAIPPSTPNPLNFSRLLSGTTAQPAGVDTYRRFPRRLAFKRDAYGNLDPVLDGATAPQDYAIPIGVNASADFQEYDYANSATVPRNANEGLWYWTTTNAGDPFGAPTNNANNGYDANALPFYYDPAAYYVNSTETTAQQATEIEKHRLVLPAPVLPDPLELARQALNGTNTTTGEDDSSDDPSDYTFCIGSGNGTTELNPTTIPADTACATGGVVGGKIQTAYTQLTDAVLPADTITTDPTPWDGTTDVIIDAINSTDDDDNGVIVYDIPSSVTTITPDVTITLKGNLSSIFVLRTPGNLTFGTAGSRGVRLELEGVNPNNVYWVVAGNLEFANASADADSDGNADRPHELAGNFIGTGDLIIGSDTEIVGGRFLRFSSSSVIPASSSITAMTSIEQPLVVPMLQIHSATGIPGNGVNAVFGGTGQNKQNSIQRQWLQVAAAGFSDASSTRETMYNGAFVGRNTPSRSDTGETSGGLHNFLRTLEMWGDSQIGGNLAPRTISIRGNIIQSGQSEYATGPFLPTDKTGTTLAGMFYQLDGSNRAIYRWNAADQGYPYRGGAASQRAPYYWPAQRSWGFDVGILYQLPDLFAQRLTTDSESTPDEYFREVGKDDEWVKVLLCAKDDGDNFVVDESLRPDDCPW